MRVRLVLLFSRFMYRSFGYNGNPKLQTVWQLQHVCLQQQAKSEIMLYAAPKNYINEGS